MFLRSFALPALMLLLILAGCQAPVQERPGVPVIWGMRLDGATSEQHVNDNFLWIREHDYEHILLEVPLRSTTLPPHLPVIDSLVLDQVSELARTAKTYGFGFHIALMTANQQQLFPEGFRFHPSDWFTQLAFVGNAVLEACGPNQPQRLIFGENLTEAESYASEWKRAFGQLRGRWQIPISYCAYSDQKTADPIWGVSDEIVVSYSASSDANALPFCREQNMRISRLADSLSKPVFILRSNLLGNDKDKLFLYRLRHWAEDIEVKGLTINTIYSSISPLDSTSYYGLADEISCLNTIEAYHSSSQKKNP